MNAKKNASRRWLLILPALLIVVTLTVFLVRRMEGESPEMTMALTSPALGASQNLKLHVIDRKSGIRKVWVAVLKDGQEVPLLDKTYSSAGLLAGGQTHEETLEIPFEPKAKGIKDGKAVLRFVGRDFSWRNWGKGNVQYQEQEIVIDTHPPVINVLSRAHYLSQGGAGIVVYKLAEECPTSGVTVGEHFYRGFSGVFEDPAIHAAMIAIDYRLGPGTPVAVTATDFAGNESRVGLQHLINARTFKRDKIALSDGFLDWKMPEFVSQVDVVPGASHLDVFLAVNRDLRRANYETLKKVTAQSDPAAHWKGEFLRLPAAANRAGFADHRSYIYKGKVVDEQTHMGIDLASLAQSPVPAANSGKVVFAGTIGIYGGTIVIDHGLGLFSMYSHLSQMTATEGRMVSKGDIIGATGVTGLAGGDHLHYGIMIHHTFVNPMEWWDGQWVRNNITSKLEAVAN
ncbi:M23 family metallopeptidase [Desulfatitalea tepidiphila]|uniref:M23 family metallopeptidase n=1 Tax=Desulfatitalea tepidiphila TaxID=1185843 RepID=UPI0006B5CCDD|nr:M23 family metallopeptidase [Desulfatitalea tepidiphila]